MSNEKIKKTLQEALSKYHPGEELRAFFAGIERLNPWLEIILLGPIAGAFSTRSYYLGLSDKRLILVTLSWWTGKSTDKVSEILLGRITKIEHKKGWLNGKLTIYYGQNIERKITFNRQQRQGAKEFADRFDLLPKQVLTDEEEMMAAKAETIYKEEKQARIGQAVTAFVVILIIILVLNFASF